MAVYGLTKSDTDMIEENDLEKRIRVLEQKSSYRQGDAQFNDVVRDIVFTSQYINTGSYTGFTTLGAGGGTVTYPAFFDSFLEVKYRGKIYRIGVYQVSQ